MPTYQYACTACGHQTEAVQSFSDPALTQCPECAGRLRKLFSSVGVVFKGSGFYRTDSRAAAKANGAKEPATSSTESSSTESSGGSSGADSSSGTSSTSSSKAATGSTSTANGPKTSSPTPAA